MSYIEESSMPVVDKMSLLKELCNIKQEYYLTKTKIDNITNKLVVVKEDKVVTSDILNLVQSEDDIMFQVRFILGDINVSNITKVTKEYNIFTIEVLSLNCNNDYNDYTLVFKPKQSNFINMLIDISNYSFKNQLYYSYVNETFNADNIDISNTIIPLDICFLDDTDNIATFNIKELSPVYMNSVIYISNIISVVENMDDSYSLAYKNDTNEVIEVSIYKVKPPSTITLNSKELILMNNGNEYELIFT